MYGNILSTLSLTLTILSASGQDDAAYLIANAVRIDNPEKLSDSVYKLLSPFQIIMFGEMHGTNESAPFVKGLTDLLTSKGDSVQVGFEIPSNSMTQFIGQHTDSSIYQSDFFSHPPYESGKESVPWASLITNLNHNPKVTIFFFEMSDHNAKSYQGDSVMYANIKTQISLHQTRKVITLGGNYHNKTSNPNSMYSLLKNDKELNLISKICSLNMEYKEGTAISEFGHGLEVKQLGAYPSVYNTTFTFDKYFLLVSPNSNYEYTGFYYTEIITAAKMVSSK